MNVFRRHWYVWDCFLGLDGRVAGMGWNDIIWVQRLLALNFIVLILHQFEEYSWPGGFPWICNEVLMPKPVVPPDRYPPQPEQCGIHQLACLVVLSCTGVVPDVIWLGIGQILFGLVGQVIVHGVIINSTLKTFYNPGLVAVILGHVPAGHPVSHGSLGQRGAVRWWDLLFGILYLGFFSGVIMQRIALWPDSPPRILPIRSRRRK